MKRNDLDDMKTKLSNRRRSLKIKDRQYHQNYFNNLNHNKL